MKLKLLLFTLILITGCYGAEGQDTTQLKKIFSTPDKVFTSLNEKASSIESKLDKKTAKYLAKLQKQEKKLYKKLWKKDSTLAKELFEGVEDKYARLN